MKTKLCLLFTAILTLGSLSSCIAPYGYGGNNRGYHGQRYNRGYSHHGSGSLGGYRGGGAGGGFGGSFGGFGR